MADNTTENSPQSKISFPTLLEIAVPLLSFGGAAIAILFEMQGISLDFRIPAFGCVLASFSLAYLAWIRPKKDIVALSTPIYSIIFFIVPTDFSVGIMLQLLYAVSLTLLLVRLKYRFGKPGTAFSLGKELGGPVKTYIEQTRDVIGDISSETAHHAALAFVRFAEGNYEDAARCSKNALRDGENPGQESPVHQAFGIVQEHADLLNTSLNRPLNYLTFSENDDPLLAKPMVPDTDEDTEFYTVLENALLLLYSIAWNYSERDRPHLLVCQAFAQKLLSSK
jgi:hypothetical protein